VKQTAFSHERGKQPLLLIHHRATVRVSTGSGLGRAGQETQLRAVLHGTRDQIPFVLGHSGREGVIRVVWGEPGEEVIGG
jgi:hypothetical protein